MEQMEQPEEGLPAAAAAEVLDKIQVGDADQQVVVALVVAVAVVAVALEQVLSGVAVLTVFSCSIVMLAVG